MRFFSRLSFRTKINLGIIGVVLVFGLVSGFLISHITGQAMLGEIKKRGLALAWNLASRTAEPLLALDFLRLKNVVDEIKGSSDDILYAFTLDQNGQVLSHTFKSGFPVELPQANLLPEESPQRIQLLDTGAERIYDFALPVQIGPNRLGAVRVGLSRAKAEAAVDRLWFTIFSVTAGVALLAVVMGTLFAGTVTRRLNVLRQSAEEMIKGNLNLQTSPQLKRNCWEIKDCQNEQCPAFGNTRRRCWNLTGVLCPGCQEVSYEERLEVCQECLVYQLNAGDEIQSLAESFDVMAMTLDAHIKGLKEAEKNLIRQQRLLKSILDVTPDLVSLQNGNLIYRAVNPAFCQFFGMQEKDILGKTDAPHFPPNQAEDHDAENVEILKTGAHKSKEVLVSRDGDKRWLHMVKVPVYDEDRITGILTAARDITEIKLYQEKLIQSLKMEQLGKLAGGVAHEINTPLCVILGYAQMLLEDFPQDTESYEYLQLIEKQAQICRRIVGDLLSFSRQLESRMEEMDLNQSIAEVIHLVRHPFNQNWVDIVTSLDQHLPAIIGDKEKLKQVWLNLLNNAADSIGQDGVIRINTRLEPQTRRVLVTVTDSGSGIAPENLKKIFDPFFTTKAPGGGTGLGLSVSFGIIQDHLGAISAVSPAPPEFFENSGSNKKAPGPGSMFLVELPVSREEPAEDSFKEFLPESMPAVDQTAV
ncbi:MAG: PAS domain S-box protein [Deltaproteobacteria bacterium]|nr:PAS domain S-box protein [Deltaproteobacteria bacterium]